MDNLENRQATDDMPDDSLNISDVIEVIETDPDFNPHPKTERIMNSDTTRPAEPKLSILVQPAPKALRFRYECEGRSAGSIPGANSTPENKTFPTIQIVDGAGIWKAVVVVSCVTKDPPYRAHPHKLVGREGCKKGVCTIEVPRDTMKVQFSNLGIQCVKKKDIEEALRTREEIRVDPYRQGFSHRNQPTSIDLNAVRLCFQGFIQREPSGRYVELKPEVSEPIFDKKAMSDLVIVKLSDCVSPVDGGTKDIILLCEKVNKEDIQVRFYEEKNGVVVWEGFGEFQPSQVHKQTAIWFKPPKYQTKEVQEPVKVNMQLRRPSDGATSLPVPFQLLPLHAVGVKRPSDSSTDYNLNKRKWIKELETQGRQNVVPDVYQPNIPMEQDIKPEPSDKLPYNQYADAAVSNFPKWNLSQFNLQLNIEPRLAQTSPNPPQPSSSLPPFQVLPGNKQWNIPGPYPGPSTSYMNQANSLPANDTVSYCNLDSQQITELKQLNLDSGDLPATNITDVNNLTENLSANLSLTDILRHDNNNMTDSLDSATGKQTVEPYPGDSRTRTVSGFFADWLLPDNDTVSYCNMDNRQITELKQVIQDSGDLPATNVTDVNNLTENLSTNLSLTDILRHDSNNMTVGK